MLGCMLELGLAAWGIYLLSTGEAKIFGSKPVRGTLVRLAGLAFLAPLPLAFIIGFSIGFSEGMKGKQFDPRKAMPTLVLLELGLIFGCFVVGSLLLWFASMNQPEPERNPLFQDRLLCDDDRHYDRVPSPTPSAPESVLDVIPVAANPNPGITAQPPPLVRPAARRPAPNLDTSFDHGPAPFDAVDEAPPREQPPYLAASQSVVEDYQIALPEPAPVDPNAKSERTQNYAVIIAAVALFFVIAIGGAVLMR